MFSLEPASSEKRLSDEQTRLIRHHLVEVIGSSAFEGSARSQYFLKIVVEHALAGRYDDLRERMLGAEMFGRPIDYDTANDAVVRVKASEVRKRLSNFYRDLEGAISVRIEIPAGSYMPRFSFPLHEEILRKQTSLLEVESNTSAKKRRVLDSPVSSRSQKLIIGAFFLLAFVVFLLFAYRKGSGNQDHQLGRNIHSIAVLPLQNLSGDLRQEYFADGMTEELIAVLGQVTPVRVISRTSSMNYKNTNKPLPVIARELGVDAVVEGGVARENNRVRITVQLVDARTDSELWASTYDRAVSSALSVQGEVAQSIAGEIRVNIAPQTMMPLPRSRPIDPAALDLYLQGLQILHFGDPGKASKYFQSSIELDPRYAPAHAALASCFGWQGAAGWKSYTEAFTRQKQEAAEAIQLDDSLPEGHAEFGSALLDLNWDWANAEKEFKRAIELNPSSAGARRHYASFYYRTNRVSEALVQARLALHIDPTNSASFMVLSADYYVARNYRAALEQINMASTLETNSNNLVFFLGVIYREMGMYDKSIVELKKLGDEPHALGHLGNAYARFDHPREALAVAKRIEKHIASEGIGRYEIALVYAGLGDKTNALKWLEDAYAVHDVGITNLLIDPCMDPLRSDPHFQNLLQRVGFPTSP